MVVGLGLAAWVFLGPLFVLFKLRQTRADVAHARRDIGDLANRLSETERRLAAIAKSPKREAESAAVAESGAVSAPAAALSPVLEEGGPAEPSPDAFAAAVPSPVEPSRLAESARPPAPDTTTRSAISPGPGTESLEQTIGVVWLTRIGTSAVLLGAAYFFKYAVDNDWIGPWPRVALGAAAGILALAIGERSRARANRIWSDLVTALGLGLLLFAAYASYAYYSLVPVAAAFAAFAVVSCLGGTLAVFHSSQSILIFSLTSACAAPALLSTGTDNPIGLFGYLLVVTGLGHAAALHRRFRIAIWIGLVGPALLFAGWYDRFFDPSAAYATLRSRAGPLGAVVLFLALWLEVHRRARRLPERSTILVAKYAAAACAGAFGLLLYDRPAAEAATLAGLGAVFALLAKHDESPGLLLASLAASGASLIAVPSDPTLHGAFIGLTVLWAAIHFGAAAAGLLGSSADVGDGRTTLRLLVVAASGIVLVVVGFLHGLGDRRTLAAALLAVVGTSDLVLGAALVQKRRGGVLAAAPLGLALGLFSASVAFLFVGPIVTVAWAALAATVVGLASARGDRVWLLGGLLLFVATVVRLVDVDWETAEALRNEFVSSLGLRGSIEPPVLFNARAYALAGVGCALLASARLAGRRDDRPFRYAAGSLVTSAHVALLALAITEARNLATPAAAVPAGKLESPELYAFLADHDRAVFAADHRLSMVTTLVLGAYAALLVSVGFGAREPWHRYLGLSLFAGTLGKLVLVDVWELERIYQISILVGVGALLLGASFLYARFGGRLLKMLGGGGAALIVGTAAPGTANAAVDVHAYAHTAELRGIEGPGLHGFEVPAPLYRASRTDAALDDLRILGPHGEETPFFVRSETEAAIPGHSASMLDPVTLPDGRVRATFDLGVAPVRHGGARLGIDGDDFLRRVQIEVSDDGKEFAVIRMGGVVYRASHAAKSTENVDVVYPTSAARYVRVTLDPGSGTVIGFTGAEFSVPAPVKHPMLRFSLSVLRTDRDVTARTSTVTLDAGEAGVPIDNIQIETEYGGFFEREADLLASSDASHWFPVGGGFMYRIPSSTETWIESLSLGAGGSRKRYFAIRFHDGDDAPLGTRTAIAEFLPQEVVFRAASGGPHRLLVGSERAPRPVYDLAAVVVRGVGDPPKSATMSPLADNPDYEGPHGARTFSQRYARYFAIALGLVVVGLGVFTFRLLRRVA